MRVVTIIPSTALPPPHKTARRCREFLSPSRVMHPPPLPRGVCIDPSSRPTPSAERHAYRLSTVKLKAERGILPFSLQCPSADPKTSTGGVVDRQMTGLRLSLLGPFRLEADSEIALPSRKAQALLAYLALPAGRRPRRDKLASLPWADRGHPAARH